MQKASALHIATSVVLTTNLPTNEHGNNYLHALILTMTFDSLRKNNFIPEDWDLDSTNILDLHICESFKLVVHSNTLPLSGRLAHCYIYIAPQKMQQNPLGSSTKNHSFKVIIKSIPAMSIWIRWCENWQFTHARSITTENITMPMFLDAQGL